VPPVTEKLQLTFIASFVYISAQVAFVRLYTAQS
jgi:hypothetical protein